MRRGGCRVATVVRNRNREVTPLSCYIAEADVKDCVLACPRAGDALEPPAWLMDAFAILDAPEAESRPLR